MELSNDESYFQSSQLLILWKLELWNCRDSRNQLRPFGLVLREQKKNNEEYVEQLEKGKDSWIFETSKASVCKLAVAWCDSATSERYI